MQEEPKQLDGAPQVAQRRRGVHQRRLGGIDAGAEGCNVEEALHHGVDVARRAQVHKTGGVRQVLRGLRDGA